MTGHARLYRSLLWLYPKAFRREYADDLVQGFDDLIGNRGPSHAWRRTVVDLTVTVPRYRLETIMNTHRADLTLYAITGVVAAAAAVSVLTAAIPGGVVLLLAALVLTVASGSTLARATRPPDTRRRRRLLRTSAALAATCVISTTIFWIELSNDYSWHAGKLIVYNAVFFTTAISALVYLAIGLRTPRSPSSALSAA